MGPLARYNLKSDKLTTRFKEAAKEAGLGPTEKNPFKSTIVRPLEVAYVIDEALRIVEQ